MKKIITILILIVVAIISNAQVKLDDFGRIILNTYLPDNISLPAEAKSLLITKLSQICSNNGMGGSQANPRFIITAVVNIGTKDIIPGPPQMIAQNLDVTLFVGDAIANTIFSNTTLSLKGVGNNESKALIDAFKTINPKNKEIIAFLDEGKTKIISYYNANCDFILKNAKALQNQEKYDEAIYQLSLVPDVCKDCYIKCLDNLAEIYQLKIDTDCKLKINKAKTTWIADQSLSGAKQAGEILNTINPMASCQPEVTALVRAIEDKLKKDEKEKWLFKMKKYTDKIEMEKIRINAYREAAVEYAKNQPKTITYNNIYWK
ncbi:MAG: hypothetical protein ACOYMA_14645 [Bacteroidia bacterium]